MRVLHIAPSAFGPSGIYGGGERYPLELARAMAADTDCELITFGARARRIREPGGLRLRTIRSWGRLHGHPAHPLPPSLPLALDGADLVHTHHLRSTPGRIAAVTGRLLGRRLAVTDHGLPGGDWGGLLPRLFDRFLLVSAFSAVQLGAPRSRTRIIYGGADPLRFTPDPAVVRRGVLFMGRITPHKGIDRLIEAMPEGAELTVAGSSGHDAKLPDRDYPLLLRRLASGRDVTFIGAPPDDALPSLYRTAAVLALPSVHRTCYGRFVPTPELLGLVVLEAMASGTPVVCSRVGGLPEIVLDGVTGYLVQPGNVAELRDRLAELLGDTARARRMGRNARELAVERFTWQACARRCLDAYAEVL